MNTQWTESSILGKLGELINEVRAERLNETTMRAFPIIMIRGEDLVSDCLDTWGLCDDLGKKIESTWGVQLGNPEPFRIDRLAKRIFQEITESQNPQWP